MTYAEIEMQVRQLPLPQRRALMNVIRESLRAELDPPARLREEVLSLRGIGKSDVSTPTDAELQEDYTRYLAKKYS